MRTVDGVGVIKFTLGQGRDLKQLTANEDSRWLSGAFHSDGFQERF